MTYSLLDYELNSIQIKKNVCRRSNHIYQCGNWYESILQCYTPTLIYSMVWWCFIHTWRVNVFSFQPVTRSWGQSESFNFQLPFHWLNNQKWILSWQIDQKLAHTYTYTISSRWDPYTKFDIKLGSTFHHTLIIILGVTREHCTTRYTLYNILTPISLMQANLINIYMTQVIDVWVSYGRFCF